MAVLCQLDFNNSHDMIAGSPQTGRIKMTDGLTSIISALETQRQAIETALTALKGVGAVAAPTHATSASTATVETSGRNGKKRTAAQRKRMAEAQRKRYADLRAESGPAVVPAPAPEAPKRKISPEGIKRIIAATKKRWRLKRAADKAALEQAEAKKAARKKAAAQAKAVKKAAPVKKTVAKRKAAASETPVPAPGAVETVVEQV